MKTRLTLLSLAAAVLASCQPRSSGRDLLFLEGNGAGPGHYVHWVTIGDRPQTCFVIERHASGITERPTGDRTISFLYGGHVFKADRSRLTISTSSGRLVEDLPLRQSIFRLHGGTYSKIDQTAEIRSRMREDHRIMGDSLVSQLRAEGKL